MFHRLIPLIFLCSAAQAANVTATTGWVSEGTLSASMTIDSGSNRIIVVRVSDEQDTSPEWVMPTIGGQAADWCYTYTETTPTPDLHVGFCLWQESTIGSMSGSAFAGHTNPTDGRWSYGTIEDAAQSDPGGFIDTVWSPDRSGLGYEPVTTTSSSGDLVCIAAAASPTGVNITAWDTLTEIDDNNGAAARSAFACGNGGDGTTDVTGNNTSADWIFGSFLVADFSGSLLLRRRR